MKLQTVVVILVLAGVLAVAASEREAGFRRLQQRNGSETGVDSEVMTEETMEEAPTESAATNGMGGGKKKKLTKAEREEKKRVEAALAADAERKKEQERQRNETLAAARITSAELVQKFRASDDQDEQASAFAALWIEGDGPAIVEGLNTLINSLQEPAPVIFEAALAGMRDVERQGLGNKVSEAVATGLVIIRQPSDARHLLELILLRLSDKNEGCGFVKVLMKDAELVAIRLGFEFEFNLAFNDDVYADLKECVFEPCAELGEEVTKCCKREKSLVSGRCGCSDDSNRCDFNLLFLDPLPVWVCSLEVCQAEQSVKCLCEAT